MEAQDRLTVVSPYVPAPSHPFHKLLGMAVEHVVEHVVEART